MRNSRYLHNCAFVIRVAEVAEVLSYACASDDLKVAQNFVLMGR